MDEQHACCEELAQAREAWFAEYQQWQGHRLTLTIERETARALAVRLEQELAETTRNRDLYQHALAEVKADFGNLFRWAVTLNQQIRQLGETPAAPPPAAAPQVPDGDSPLSPTMTNAQAIAEQLMNLPEKPLTRKHDAKHAERAP
jgi:hypothetical protein